MSVRKTLAMVLALLICLTMVLSGCAKNEPAPATDSNAPATSKEPSTSTGGKIKIGVSISNFDDTFLMYMKDGMDEYAKSLGSVEVTYVDA